MYRQIDNKNGKKILCFCLFIVTLLAASVVITALAAEKSGMYWTGMKDTYQEAKQGGSQGFMMVDVSDSYLGSSSDVKAEAGREDTEVVPIGIGPIPSVPSLTEDELKLYGLLSKGDGFILSDDKNQLDEDVHWQEVVLEPGDTIETVASEYGLNAADIRRANELKPGEKIKNAEVLFIPDKPEYILNTLAYVRKLKQAEDDLKKRGKPVSVTAYVVKQGDSLWSISSEFDVDLDTIIGSNKLSDINKLKLGTTLRIPNQEGIFVRVSKKDTASGLADKYGSYKEAIYVANSLEPGKPLPVGTEIFLPGAKLLAAVETMSGRKSGGMTASARISSVVSSRLRWPIAGQISSPFGWRSSPFSRRRVLHSGIDIRAPRGRGITAAADGRVVHTGWMGGYGYTVVIMHSGGMSTLYGHCSSIATSRGAVVKRGQLIARAGSTGRSTGNHLHFEVRKGGTPVNPIRYLR